MCGIEFLLQERPGTIEHRGWLHHPVTQGAQQLCRTLKRVTERLGSITASSARWGRQAAPGQRQYRFNREIQQHARGADGAPHRHERPAVPHPRGKLAPSGITDAKRPAPRIIVPP